MITKTIPLTQKDFAWVKYDKTKIISTINQAIVYKKGVYKKVKKILPEDRTFENTIFAIMTSLGEFGDKVSCIGILADVLKEEKIRNYARGAITSFSKKMVDIEYDRDVYIAALEYYEGNYSDEKKSLRKEDIKLVEDLIRDYKRMGFDLPNEKQNELKKVFKRLTELGNEFDKNLNDHEDFILCSKDELAGLSENVISILPIDTKTAKYKVTLQYPHLHPFMAFASNRDKRKELAKKDLQKGGKQNIKILKEMVQLRSRVASLLSYAHYVDYRLEDKMAKNADTVSKMIDGLIKKIAPLAKKDIGLLKTSAKEFGVDGFEYYDIAFVSNKTKQKLFGYNPEEVREYFPLNHVIEMMFNLFEKLFGVTIKRKAIILWDSDVTTYEVSDTKTKSLIGYMVFDLFPRIGKYGHAGVSNLVHHKENVFKGGEAAAPLSVMLCNFPRNTKQTPSLLSFSDVEALFHEFGHCLHGILSKSVHEAQSGTNVARDFVETPSQIMENWVWDERVIKKISKHYKTKKSLPDNLVKKVTKGKRFQSAHFYMRQLILTKLDIDMHKGLLTNPQKTYRDMVYKYLSIRLPEKETFFPASWGHMNGYDTNYYGYLWALVYACDAFEEFKKKGNKNVMTNTVVGLKWRREVLEKGSSEDEMKLLENFLGCKPSQKAFLKEVIGK